VLAVEMLPSDLYIIRSRAFGWLMKWESSIEEVQMAV